MIDRARVGIDTKYIDVVPGSNLEFSETWIKRAHGSGRYKLLMVDAGNGRRQVTKLLDIDDPDFPPNEDPKELALGNPKNKSEEDRLRRRGLLPESEEQMQESNSAVAAMASTITALAEKAAAPKPEQDSATLEKVLALVERMNGPRLDPMAIAKQVQELQGGGGQNAILMKLLEMFAERAAPAPVVPAAPIIPGIGGLDDFIKLKSFFDSLNGGGGGSDSGMGGMVEKFLPLAIPLFAKLLDRPAAGFSVPPGYVLLPAGAGGMAGIQGAPEGYPAFVPHQAAAPAAPIPQGGDDMNFLDAFRLGRAALEAFQRGVSGDSFADSLVSDPLGVMKGKGDEIYSALAAAGKEQILAFIKSSPAWAQISARLPEVEVWVNEFLAYGAPDDGAAPADGEGVAAC